MKQKININTLFKNNKIVFIFSFLSALAIWLMVVINVSPATTRVISDVKVMIDTSVPSQFGLEVFGQSEFTVDVTVKGKKYLISPAALSGEDIVVTAQTNNVDSAGKRTLQLKAESVSGNRNYTIESLSMRTVDVYFDTAKTVEFVVEPSVVTDGFEIVEEGYTSGDVNLSQSYVTISGPATEVNRIEKVVAELELSSALTSNKSADAKIVALDDAGKSNFKYITVSHESVVLTIPVLKVKELETIVTFKNAPDFYVVNPLTYSISPAVDMFNISVDEYDKTENFSVGTIDFKSLSPTNRVFTFNSSDVAVAEESDTGYYTVSVNVSGLKQEYISFPQNKIRLNNPGKKPYKVSGLNKSVVVVGDAKALESITDKELTVEVDLSEVNIKEGQSISIPAVVNVKSDKCWVYGTYTVDVSL